MIDDELVRKARAAKERLARAAGRAEREIEHAETLLEDLGLGAPVWIPLGPRIIGGGFRRGGSSGALCLGYSDEGDGRWSIKVGVRSGGERGPAQRTRPARSLPRTEQAAIVGRLRALIEEALREADRLADALERGAGEGAARTGGDAHDRPPTRPDSDRTAGPRDAR